MIGTLADLCRGNRLVNSAAQYTYLYLLPHLLPERAGTYQVQGAPDRDKPCVAFICDEMTWLDFREACNAIFLSPRRWRQQMEQAQPQCFFCESAWEGNIGGWPDWRGRIYHNRGLWFENRRELLALLDYCRARGIPTVFWNKEDPFLGSPQYDFVDTGLRFDWVFTTAAECVPSYEQRGHNQVRVLPFGINTDLFCPGEGPKEEGRVIFAGSWFADLPQRCRAMSQLFDHVLDRGMKLDIYNRKSECEEKKFQFPQRYEPYLHKGVPFREMPALLRRYEYALNVNTVTDSKTMCSRRVLQMAACGMKLITNPSAALEGISGLRQYASAEGGAIQYWQSDPQEIARCHSSTLKFQTLLAQVLKGTESGAERTGAAAL